MTEYSKSLTIVWEIAAREAVDSSSEEITPSHFLIALCKICDRQIPEIKEEIHGLLDRFHGIDLKQLRRRLRSLITNSNLVANLGEKINRSAESKQAFQRAEEIAQSKENNNILPEHFLQAILEPINSPLADALNQLGMPDFYEDIFSDVVDNDDRLRREAVRSILEKIDLSEIELQDLLASQQTSNPSKSLEQLCSSGESNPRLRDKLFKVAEKALEDLTHNAKVRKLVTETSIDVLMTVFFPLGLSAKAINILLEKSEPKDR